MPSLLKTVEQNITPRRRTLLDHLWQKWKTLDCDIETVSQDIEAIASQDTACQRLQQIPGVGPLVSTATVAAIGNGAAFRKGRAFAAWLGLKTSRDLWDVIRLPPLRILGLGFSQDLECPGRRLSRGGEKLG